MAKLNQAQEPSMEEILASIRRIISDDGEDAEVTTRPDQLENSISTAAIDALFGQRAAPAPAETAPADPALPSFLRAEERNAVRAEPAVASARPVEQRGADPRMMQGRGADVRTESRAAEAYVRGAGFSGFQTAEPSSAQAGDASRTRFAGGDGLHPEVQQPAASGEDWAGDGRAAAAALQEDGAVNEQLFRRVASDTSPAGSPRFLTSPETDAAVAASFVNLAQTLLGDQPRTLEDLVKDMMRPMLQSWLDANLPSIVERMVREEIERVARSR